MMTFLPTRTLYTDKDALCGTSLPQTRYSGVHCLGGTLACNLSFILKKLTYLLSLTGFLKRTDLSHAKRCNFTEVFVVLPCLTHQIDDMAETGHMHTVGHHTFQNLPVCFQAVCCIICDHCPDISAVQTVAVEGAQRCLGEGLIVTSLHETDICQKVLVLL